MLSLEPLLATIQSSVDIGGVKIREEEHKVATNADDMPFYISTSKTTLPNLIKEMKNTENSQI